MRRVTPAPRAKPQRLHHVLALLFFVLFFFVRCVTYLRRDAGPDVNRDIAYKRRLVGHERRFENLDGLPQTSDLSATAAAVAADIRARTGSSSSSSSAVRGSGGSDSTLAGGGGCPPIAQSLLERWRGRTNWGSRQLAREGPPSTAAMLQKLGIVEPHDYCYCKFRFNGSGVGALDDFREHCYGQPAGAARARAAVFEQYFNKVLGARLADAGLSPFEFYIDFTDGTRQHEELAQALGTPILCSSRNPNDRYRLPIPFFDIIVGLHSKRIDFAALPQPDGAIFKQAASFILIPLYAGHGWPKPWSKAVGQYDKLFYRGSCYPTIASNNTNPHSRVNLRSQVCAKHHGSAKLDIGLDAGVENCRSGGSPPPAYCADCKLCPKKDRLIPSQQSKYRYQAIVEGQAATYDAAAWKLLSNSTVIRVRPDGWDTPIFDQFYDPLLEPGVHILHSNVSGLPGAVEQCEREPGRCEAAAVAARQVMTCLLHPEVIADYFLGVFKYMHESVGPGQGQGGVA